MTYRVGCTCNGDRRARPRVLVDDEVMLFPWWRWCWAEVFA